MVNHEDTREEKGQFDYLDFLASVLTEHEKHLDKLVEEVEKVTRDLIKVTKYVAKEETLTYIRLKLNRSTEDLKTILESLKDHDDIPIRKAPKDGVELSSKKERKGKKRRNMESETLIQNERFLRTDEI